MNKIHYFDNDIPRTKCSKVLTRFTLSHCELFAHEEFTAIKNNISVSASSPFVGVMNSETRKYYLENSFQSEPLSYRQNTLNAVSLRRAAAMQWDGNKKKDKGIEFQTLSGSRGKSQPTSLYEEHCHRVSFVLFVCFYWLNDLLIRLLFGCSFCRVLSEILTGQKKKDSSESFVL